MTSFEKQSYESHRAQFDKYTPEGSEAVLAESWLDARTVDAWRHERIYKSLDPILELDKDSSWLTVGDGRYGLDAQYLAKSGVEVTASDISGNLLERAFDLGLISKYEVENAEYLSFQDKQYDYVFCKDAYHHFPRPPKALYEMLRVASRGVVLIEPSDHDVHGKILDRCVSLVRKIRSILRGTPAETNKDYEESGNYVFRVSKREMEKIALGLNYPVIAFKGLNDYYEKNMAKELVQDNGPCFRRAKLAIRLLDILSKLRLRDYRLMAIIFLKELRSEDQIIKLRSHGFDVVRLSRNPYI